MTVMTEMTGQERVVESEKKQLEEFERAGNYKKTHGIIYENNGIKSLVVLCPYCTEVHTHGYIEGQCKQCATFRESHCCQGIYSIELTEFDNNKGMFKYLKVKYLAEYLEKHHIRYKSIHGVDEEVIMTRSEHRKLHERLRKKNIYKGRMTMLDGNIFWDDKVNTLNVFVCPETS